MKRDFSESVYDVVINISSGWFGVAVIRQLFKPNYSGHELSDMLYSLFMGSLYFLVAQRVRKMHDYGR